MQAKLNELGAEYISADAQSSVEKQLSDIESLITRGADVLIVLAQDNEAILPAITRAEAEGIPVVAYDRLIEAPDAFYLTFDNVEVGRMQAQAIFDVQPTGNYVFIKGSPLTPTRTFCTGDSSRFCNPPSTRARLPWWATSTPTAGCPKTRSATWSKS